VLIRIVGTQESAQLNQRYRGRRGPTNVLAFLSDLPATPASQAANAGAQGGATAAAAVAAGAAGGATPGDAANVVAIASSPDASPPPAPPAAPSADPLPLGDLVICAPVISREAREQRKSFDAHWAHIVVHGVLHLLGYDHETEVEAQTMEDRERKILAGLGFRDPYALRN
jgi:rRNA maturation RNase YbeY